MKMKENWEDKLTAAYIRDSHFAWLPVDVVSKTNDGEAMVRLLLPEDWQKVTCNSDHPSLKKSEKTNDDGHIFRRVKLGDYAGNVLPLRNVDENGNMKCKRDLGDLSFLHEASILYNLRYFHSKGTPYTRVNDIVVSVNPFYWIEGMYSNEKQQKYADQFVWNTETSHAEDDFTALESQKLGQIEPHIFETSCKAYRGMIFEQKNQTILVSGVSGAGKTETVKIVMNQLATLYQTMNVSENSRLTAVPESYSTQLEERIKTILESNPIFESFGNAKTVRNDNSSRFGKFTELVFDIEKKNTRNEEKKDSDNDDDIPSSFLVGSAFETYLLEKSRVVGHSTGERSFHIFYQLLSAPEVVKGEIWEGLKGKDYQAFKYLAKNATSQHDIDDKTSWEETKCALEDYGMSGDKFVTLFRAICIVLQLGNLTFSSKDGNEDISALTSDAELTALSQLMEITEEDLTKVLTTREVKTFNEDILKYLNVDEANEARDALAKEIYFQVFNLLVEQMNEYSGNFQKSKGISRSISLLDLFGFESFTKNRFEQLCINYANEQLQKIYVLENFHLVQEEYMKEGIKVCDFSDVDNSEIIDMIQGRMGLISILNDECLRPKGNDASFVYKLKKIYKISDSLVHKPLHRPTEFAINHFAGLVTYDATNFVNRNKDDISKDILKCASTCTNNIICASFQTLLSDRLELESRKGRKKIITITSKFRSQLNELVKHIASTQSRFIRCIKPNDEKAPYKLDHLQTMKQLSSSGLVTALTISRETYPNSLPYKDVWGRFNCLLRSKEANDVVDEQTKAKHIVEKYLGKVADFGNKIEPYAFGKTKIFFRPGALEILESERLNLYNSNATIIQSWVRTLNAVAAYRLMYNSFVLLQTKIRGFLSRKRYRDTKAAIVTIQCGVRCAWARNQLYVLKLNHSATMIQCRWRFMRMRNKLNRNRSAATVIQRAWLASRDRSIFVTSLAVCVEQAQKDQRLKSLQKQIQDADETTDQAALLLECSAIMGYLGSELFKERGKSYNLRAQVINTTKQSHDLKNNMGTMSDMSAANKFELLLIRKQNQQLRAKIDEQSQKLSETKSEIRSLSESSITDTAALTLEMENMSTLHQEEIKKLQTQREEEEKKCILEKQRLRNQIEELEEKHAIEIENMNLEFQKINEDHEMDISRMLDALETTQNLSSKVSHMDEREINDLRERYETMTQNYQDDVHDLKALINMSCTKCKKERSRHLPKDYTFKPRSNTIFQ